MADNTLIRVLRGKLTVELPFKALMGNYGDRLKKAYGGDFTISDHNLREKLTKEEYADLCAKYDYLVPPILPPEPPLLDDMVESEPVAEETKSHVEEVEPLAEPEPKEEQPKPKRRGRKPKTD